MKVGVSFKESVPHNYFMGLTLSGTDLADLNDGRLDITYISSNSSFSSASKAFL